MRAYPKDVAKAAKWIWDRKERSIDWNWPVLTKRNPDTETLGFDDVKSFQIFTILEKRGLIEPFQFTGENNMLVTSFKLILADEDDWKEAKRLGSFWHDWIVRPLGEIFTDFGKASIWLLSVVVTALVTKWIG